MNEQLKKRAILARRLGNRAERATLWILWFQGWDLVATNLKLGKSELDLLMARGAELRLLEVKARKAHTWVAADTALSYPQRLRLQRALRNYLDRVPWPGSITFQRVSWSGWRCRFHPPERWDAFKMDRA
ncbi:MAG: hypothetical protein H6Q00_2414 [Holophagaceae bacterium]|nr:hypothetical protein [Holophagaceae bacterium]